MNRAVVQPLKLLFDPGVHVHFTTPLRRTEPLAGLQETVAGVGAITTRVAVVLWLRPPLTPVIVKVAFVGAMPVVVVTVSTDEFVAGLGLNAPLAPEGRPLTLRATGPLKPPTGLIVMV